MEGLPLYQSPYLPNKEARMPDKTLFITGAATGIGLATARRLHEMGWRVWAGVMPGQPSTDLTRDLTDRLTPVTIDITQAESVAAAAALVAEGVGSGGLYGLVNNAGVANLGSGVVAGASLEEAHQLFEINVFGTLRVIQAFLPLLHQYGPARIVNLSSGAVRVPVPTSAIYNMSKSAIEGLTKTLRYELAPFNIDVVAIEPGGVRTPMTANAEANIQGVWERMSPAVRARYEAPLKPAQINLVRQLESANAPERIAEGIIHALTTPRPRPRYTVGQEVRWLPLIQRLLPETLFERVLLGQFGLQRGAAIATE